MDKFVVKTSRNLHPKVKNTSDKKHLSQSTLQSLAGVVVIEDFIKAKNSLEDKSETCDSVSLNKKDWRVFIMYISQGYIWQ